jgi:lincosamide nucleotidyltransferase A/C/D/E
MKNEKTEMTAQDVAAFVRLLEHNQIEVCIDGGWAVDALVGRLTRAHLDLDIAIQHKDAGRVRALLEERGYRDVARPDTRDCNFVLGDEQGHLIDIHTYTFDAEGKLVFGVDYPFDSLKGSGKVDGLAVRCITPEWLVKFHSGYPLDENDYHDVKVLCQHFGIKMPADFIEFVKRDSDYLPDDSSE